MVGVFQNGATLNSCNLKTRLQIEKLKITRMWANAQRDGRPTEYSWRPLFNAAKFG